MASVGPNGPRRDEVDLAIDTAYSKGWNAALRELEGRLAPRAENQTVKQVLREIEEIRKRVGNG